MIGLDNKILYHKRRKYTNGYFENEIFWLMRAGLAVKYILFENRLIILSLVRMKCPGIRAGFWELR